MRSYPSALLCAVQFLTRIPLRPSGTPCADTHRRTLIMFPACGWLIGLILIICWLLLPFKTPQSALCMAVLLIGIETWLTGAFHLDGLADSADAFLSPPSSPERKLAIMQDSRIGVMGAVALILSLLIKTVLLAEALSLGLIGALVVYPVIGRWIQVVLFSASPYVRPDGIGREFARAADIRTVLGASVLLLPAVLLSGFWTGLICVFIALFLLRRTAHNNIGGITGDTVGAACVLAEIAFLLGVVVAAG